MEKMVLERLEWHLEGLQLLPETMIGFRKHVSTQDAMLRIKNQVFDLPSTAQLRTIVGVDMQRAFDSVTHRAILENLKATKPGPRVYNYVKDFLSERTVKVQLDEYVSPNHPITRGTPQGSILPKRDLFAIGL